MAIPPCLAARLAAGQRYRVVPETPPVRTGGSGIAIEKKRIVSTESPCRLRL